MPVYFPNVQFNDSCELNWIQFSRYAGNSSPCLFCQLLAALSNKGTVWDSFSSDTEPSNTNPCHAECCYSRQLNFLLFCLWTIFDRFLPSEVDHFISLQLSSVKVVKSGCENHIALNKAFIFFYLQFFCFFCFFLIWQLFAAGMSPGIYKSTVSFLQPTTQETYLTGNSWESVSTFLRIFEVTPTWLTLKTSCRKSYLSQLSFIQFFNEFPICQSGKLQCHDTFPKLAKCQSSLGKRFARRGCWFSWFLYCKFWVLSNKTVGIIFGPLGSGCCFVFFLASPVWKN